MQIFSVIASGVKGMQTPSSGCGTSLSQFLGCPADVLLPHLLADRNYLLRKQDPGRGFVINGFGQVWVAGDWMRRRLLDMPGITLTPDQVVAIGAPRVDLLREISARRPKTAQATGNPRVLWAPGHDAWRPGDHLRSGYSELRTRLEQLDSIDLTIALHPRNRPDKTPLDESLIAADIVVSDYSSVLYEAWALGKPVVFPHWLMADHIPKRAPGSAEAHIYHKRIGHHADSLEALVDLLHQPLEISDAAQDFISDYLVNATETGSCIAEIRKHLQSLHGDADIAPRRTTPAQTRPRSRGDETRDRPHRGYPVANASGAAIHFLNSSTRNYADVQAQIRSVLGAHLRDAGFAVTDSPEDKPDACTIAMFIRDQGDVFIGHNLADKGYMLQRDDHGDALINRFAHVFVPGNWHRRRLLRSRHCKLRPEQIHLLGAPRVDFLRARRDARAQPDMVADGSRPLKVLWAPTHDRWTLKGVSLSSYPALKACLGHEQLAARTDIAWTTILHPRNRDEKTALTDALIAADIVVSDYSSVLYEAWALGKPVIFPRWLLGDHVLTKAPESAEAHIYRARIGYHADNIDEFCDLLRPDLAITQDVHVFMRDYLHNYEQPGCGEQAARLLEKLLDPEQPLKKMLADMAQALSERRWDAARRTLRQCRLDYNAGLPLPDPDGMISAAVALLWSLVRDARQARRWGIAQDLLRELIHYAPDSAEAHNELAHMLRKQGKWWQEVEALKAAVALDDRNAGWFLRLGEALAVMKRFRQAAQAITQAIARKPDQAEWHFRLGYAHARDGHDGPANPVAAQQAYAQAIALDTEHDAKRYGIGVFHQLHENWIPARDAYRLHLQTTPQTDAELFYRLGMAHDRCYEWAEAASNYRRAIALDSQNAAWHFRLGFVMERQNKLSDAAQAYKRAARMAAEHNPYWFYRWGYVLQQQGHHAEAVQAYLQMQAEEQPDMVSQMSDTPAGQRPLHGRSHVLDDQTGLLSPDARRHALTAWLENDASNALHWFQLGKEHEFVKDWARAAACYEQAVMRQNDHTPIWYYRWGCALARAAKFQQACEAFRHMRVFQNPHGLDENKSIQKANARRSTYYIEFCNNYSIDERIILYEAFQGDAISCNLFAVFGKLLEDSDFSKNIHVWVLNDASKAPAWIRKQKNVVIVRRDSDLYLVYLARSKYLINNHVFPSCFSRRVGQLYLNTWHEGQCTSATEDQGFQNSDVPRNLLHTTHIISPNLESAADLLKGSGIESIVSAEIYQIDHAMTDMALDICQVEKDRIRRELGILGDEKAIFFDLNLFASSGGTGKIDIDIFKNHVFSSAGLLGWRILIREKYNTESDRIYSDDSIRIIPDHIDNETILSVTDAFVTNHLANAHDAVMSGNKVIIYGCTHDDAQKIQNLNEKSSRLNFVICQSIAELIDTVQKIKCNDASMQDEKRDLEETKSKRDFLSDKIVDIFFRGIKHPSLKISRENNLHTILCFMGSFVSNGITSSFTNLVRSVDGEKVKIFVTFEAELISEDADRQYQYGLVKDYVKTLPRNGILGKTIEESWVNSSFMNDRTMLYEEKSYIIEAMYKREYRRLFGNTKFDTIINFEGYIRYWTILFALQEEARKIIYLHNDMWREHVCRFPSQEVVFNYYNKFDSLVSVSGQTNALNKTNLMNRYKIDEDRFSCVSNMIDVERILSWSHMQLEYSDDEFLFEGDGPIFLNIARLSVEKGHDQLIEAFSRVHQHHRDAKLVILGDGPCRHDLHLQIRALGLEDNVHLLGWRRNPYSYLKNADCFILSSKYEGQGLVLLEAMVLGVPIVCTDFPCAHDVLDFGSRGLIVPNSAEGLAAGIQDFIVGKIRLESFDHHTYQARALSLFYQKVCGMKVP